MTLAVRLGIGIVFLSAAVEKTSHLARFSVRINALGIPASVAPYCGAAVCLVEAMIGLSLIAGILWRLSLVASALLLVVFAWALTRKASDSADCECGGVAELLSAPEHGLARNLILAAIAVAAAVPEVSALSVAATMPGLRHVSSGLSAFGLTVAFSTIAMGAAALAAREILRVRAKRELIDIERFGENRG